VDLLMDILSSIFITYVLIGLAILGGVSFLVMFALVSKVKHGESVSVPGGGRIFKETSWKEAFELVFFTKSDKGRN
jgi:Trk-type K+ transport system membrane component